MNCAVVVGYARVAGGMKAAAAGVHHPSRRRCRPSRRRRCRPMPPVAPPARSTADAHPPAPTLLPPADAAAAPLPPAALADATCARLTTVARNAVTRPASRAAGRTLNANAILAAVPRMGTGTLPPRSATWRRHAPSAAEDRTSVATIQARVIRASADPRGAARRRWPPARPLPRASQRSKLSAPRARRSERRVAGRSRSPRLGAVRPRST